MFSDHFLGANLRNAFLQLPHTIFLDDPVAMKPYAADATPGYFQMPLAVLMPERETDIPTILSLIHLHQLSVTVRGAGTGKSAGAVPSKNGVILSLEKLNRILEIDSDNRMAIVEAGVITGEFQRFVEEKGLFYPPDPASLDTCTIGGNVAENAGGPRALKYGVTGNYVLGLSGYLVDGSPFCWGGKRVKDVAGYDLMRLMVGSEGTLGIVTQVTLRLLPKPGARRQLLALFNAKKRAVEALRNVISQGVSPSIAEYLDGPCLETAGRFSALPFPISDAAVIFEVDGVDDASADSVFEHLISILKKIPDTTVLPLTNPQLSESVWSLRRQMSKLLTQRCPEKVSEDIAVPPAAIVQAMQNIGDIGKKTGLLIVGYGHLGDGNIHVNFLKENLDDGAWKKALEVAVPEVMKMAVDLGGTITGEHGVGLSKRSFLPLQFSQSDLALMRRVKMAFDPDYRLNPGKIL